MWKEIKYHQPPKGVMMVNTKIQNDVTGDYSRNEARLKWDGKLWWISAAADGPTMYV